MSETVPVLVNQGGGSAKAAGPRIRGQVEAAFTLAGVRIALELLPGDAIAGRAAELVDEATIVVGGGDGTIGCAAGALAGTGTALGILPLGTRNHLSGELGIPADLTAAAKVIAARSLRHIDLARVNGRAFVNNASIGLYPAMVELRDASESGGALGKKLAAVPAAFAALRRMRHHRLRLQMDGDGREVVTPMLFVGNNRYLLERGRLGERAALDDGKLSVFAVRSRHRAALIGFALRAVLGGADPARDFAALGDVPELTVAGRSREVTVALDGELVRLAMPLRFSIERQALSVIAPPA